MPTPTIETVDIITLVVLVGMLVLFIAPAWIQQTRRREDP